jgi:asparagine synthase (glutamine-hydrolysing)
VSGIAGCVRWDGGRDAADIAPMLAAMQHRMPHETTRIHSGAVDTSRTGAPAIWTDGVAVLGHLQSTPSRCSLAVTSDAAVVMTGRLHHRSELVARCDADARLLHANDAEVVCVAYARFGAECLQHVEGDFAIVIWDRRERRLLCVRDRAGAKPLTWSATRGEAFVATDTQAIRAIRRVAGAATYVNDERVADFLTDEVGDARSTFYRDIERVPAATYVDIRPGRITHHRYWQPPRGVRPGSTSHESSVREDVERFRHLFDDAVRQRMPRDETIGILLSGGIDSSSIAGSAAAAAGNAASASAATPAKPIGISAVFPDLPKSDETQFISAVVAFNGMRSVRARVDDCNPLAYTSSVIACHDEPPWVPNLFMQWHGMLPAARDNGVTTVLTGFDGDTIVSDGFGRVHDLFWGLRWPQLWRESATAGIRRLPRTILRRAIVPRVPMWARRAKRAVHRDHDGIPVLLRKDVARATRLRERSLEHERVFASARDDADAHWLSVMAAVNSYEAEMFERSAAAHGIAGSHPFYDHRLIEHCVTVDSDRKVRNGETRWILREAMADVLPASIRSRQSKADLSGCFERGIRSFQPGLVHDLIERNRHRIAGFVNTHELSVIAGRFSTQARPFDALALWKCALLGEWLAYAEQGAAEQSVVDQWRDNAGRIEEQGRAEAVR